MKNHLDHARIGTVLIALLGMTGMTVPVGSARAEEPMAALGHVVAGVLRTEAAGREPMNIPFWLAADRLRMDITVPTQMSVIWRFDELPSMQMIQRQQQRYVEWGATQLEGARQLMASRPPDSFDAADWRVEALPGQQPIGGWDASETRVSSSQEGGSGTLWLSRDIDIGLEDLFAHFGAALAATTRFPMTGGDNDILGLGAGVTLPLEHLAQLPALDGFSVVRVVVRRDIGSAADPSSQASAVITLQSVGPETSLSVFDVPVSFALTRSLASGEP